ncbi:MAG: hypothetical protein F6J90_19905 [Moorea sp. SIOASIH]|nr:hypothetical protein [Moorena sp. SIOASIH]
MSNTNAIAKGTGSKIISIPTEIDISAPISIGVITGLLASYGTIAVAGFGIASRVESFSQIVLIALSASIGPFVGQNWGAKKYLRVHQALRLSFLFCLL